VGVLQFVYCVIAGNFVSIHPRTSWDENDGRKIRPTDHPLVVLLG
jgi:hypothetical protein